LDSEKFPVFITLCVVEKFPVSKKDNVFTDLPLEELEVEDSEEALLD